MEEEEEDYYYYYYYYHYYYTNRNNVLLKLRAMDRVSNVTYRNRSLYHSDAQLYVQF